MLTKILVMLLCLLVILTTPLRLYKDYDDFSFKLLFLRHTAASRPAALLTVAIGNLK